MFCTARHGKRRLERPWVRLAVTKCEPGAHQFTNNEASKVKPNDVVMVYYNPVTEKRPEGKAKLIREYRPDTGDGLPIWYVEFLDEPGTEYLRAINRPATREV